MRHLFQFTLPMLPIAVTLLSAGTARADETVELTSGASYKGDVIEKVPGDHVTIKLATNEIKTIPWSELKSGSSGGGDVKISVESDHEETTLFRMSAAGYGVGVVNGSSMAVGFEQYEPVCTAPCRANVDGNSTYVVGGDGVVGSGKFHLPQRGSIGLQVEGGSRGRRGGGAALATLGILGLSTGIAFAVVGAVEPSTSYDLTTGAPQPNGFKSTATSIGIASLAGGAAFLAGGIALIATSGTKVKTGDGERLAKGEIPITRGVSLTPRGITF